LLLPFAIYFIAEEIGVSGVIAVVASGLTVAQCKKQLSEAGVAQSKSVLETVISIISGLIFILIGLEFPQVLKNIPNNQFLPLTGVAFLIFWVALLIRMVIIFRYKIHTQKQYMLVAERVKKMTKRR
jgi:CPA1 family monovalent cation:H+ antiporter